MTQGIRVRNSIDRPFEAILRRWDECLLRSDRKIFKFWPVEISVMEVLIPAGDMHCGN